MTFAQVTFDDFEKVKIAVGRVVTAEEFPEARKPAIKMTIDFGDELGVKKSSAQITDFYTPDELVGRLVMAVVNFPPRQIGPFISEVLTLGVPSEGYGDASFDGTSGIVLLSPDRDVPLGSLMF
jgi:tRNA-binding protein